MESSSKNLQEMEISEEGNSLTSTCLLYLAGQPPPRTRPALAAQIYVRERNWEREKIERDGDLGVSCCSSPGRESVGSEEREAVGRKWGIFSIFLNKCLWERNLM